MSTTTKRRNRIVLAAAGLATAALALTACGSSSDGAKDAPSQAAKAGAKAEAAADETKATSAKSDVKITKSGFEDDEMYGANAYMVHFKITNSTDAPKDYFAQLRFLDKDGDLLGSTGVTADELGSGKTHADKTAPLDVEIDNGKMSDIASVEIGDVTRTAP